MIDVMLDKYRFTVQERNLQTARDAIRLYGFLIATDQISWPAFSALIKAHYNEVRALWFANEIEKF